MVSNDEYLGIDYNAFHALLTVAVQELNQKVNNLTVVGTNTDVVTASDRVITPQLVSDGSLVINSGSSGDVVLDGGSNNAVVKIGSEHAAAVDIARPGATTSVKGALVAEGPTDFHGYVTMHFSTPEASFKIDNGSPTPSFSVAGNGDVTTAGTIISKGGSFQMLGTAGQQLISFDQAGNANFSGNLNLASASLRGGLSIGGDINVAGLSTFQKLATFFGKTVFRQDVQFDGHLTVANDTAGYASLRAGESTVHVTFTTPYETSPIVNAAPSNGQFASFATDQVTTTGFDIKLAAPAAADIKFSWTALGVIDPQTADNPLAIEP